MKIVVIVRTRNEHANIRRFCASYKWADKIIVGDGGSEDDTVSLARQYANVEIRNYGRRIELSNGYWRNPDSDHTNWLIEIARTFSPDWIISDDCDIAPNWLLRRDARLILTLTPENYIMAVRFYLWGCKEHFPWMAKPERNHGYYEPSLWAWRGDQDFKTVDVPPAFTFKIGDLDVKDLHKDAKTYDIMPPYCLIHYSWSDKDRLEAKLKTYRESGFIPNMAHPLNFAGPLEALPNFVHL